MIENVATFDYRTQEEVLTVVKYATSVLSTSGIQIVEILSPSHLSSQLRTTVQQPQTTESADAVRKMIPLLFALLTVHILEGRATHTFSNPVEIG